MEQAERIRAQGMRLLLGDVVRFTQYAGGLRLRTYQEAVARAVIRSVLGGLGRSLVVMFPRQSGKNELQARLEAYLLFVLGRQGGEMVKISPTYQPQCLNAMRRLERALDENQLMRGKWQKQAGNLYRYGHASLTFLSGAPGSNIVGATASALLQVDEAQDVLLEKFDREIAPMAASTHATRVFWGTAWTSQTLLGRELRQAEAAQAADGEQRVFRLAAEAVSREVPAYGAHVQEQVRMLGRQHPLVRTQYFSEEIEAGGSLFDAQRISLMQGGHAVQDAPQAGERYAMLVDLAGEDESTRQLAAQGVANPGRDASAVTMVCVDGRGGMLMGKPLYRVVRRWLWVGERQTSQFERLQALAEHWQVERLVVDASGVGAGLASFLQERFGARVMPVVFNAALKSRIGWGFLGLIDSGRFKEHACTPDQTGEACQLQALFWRQLAGTTYSVLPGPEKHIRWGVPDGTRDPADGSLLHDDLVVSAALAALLDGIPWGSGLVGQIVPAADPLKEMDGGFRDELFHRE